MQQKITWTNFLDFGGWSKVIIFLVIIQLSCSSCSYKEDGGLVFLNLKYRFINNTQYIIKSRVLSEKFNPSDTIYSSGVYYQAKNEATIYDPKELYFFCWQFSREELKKSSEYILFYNEKDTLCDILYYYNEETGKGDSFLEGINYDKIELNESFRSSNAFILTYIFTEKDYKNATKSKCK